MNWRLALSEISQGDPVVYDFLSDFFQFCHAADDAYDKSPITAEQFAAINARALFTFARNEFFQKHKDFILPVLLMATVAWITSEEFSRRESVIDRITSQVMKSQYVDVLLATAFLKGGWDHLMAMSRKYREYDFDPVKPAEKGREDMIEAAAREVLKQNPFAGIAPCESPHATKAVRPILPATRQPRELLPKQSHE